MNATATAAEETPQDETVEEHIIRLSKLSYERLPLLEVVFDRYQLALGPQLKSFTSTATEVSLRSFDYLSCGEALQELSAPNFLAVVDARPWEGQLLLAVEPPLLIAALEIMLGGRKATPRAWTPRSFTSIEKRFGTRLCEMMLHTLQEAFGQLAEVELGIDHLESTPQSTVLAPPSTPCVRVVLDVTMEERGGQMTYILPYNAFEKVRPILAQAFLGGKIGGDSSWRRDLTEKLHGTNVTLAASLHEISVPLEEVLEWKPGVTLDLGIGPDASVTVNCNGMAMFRGAMGRRRNGAIALRVTEDLGRKEDLHDVASD